MNVLAPSSIVRLYEADSEAAAKRLASADAVLMAKSGYVAASERWTEGGRPLAEGSRGLRGRAVILGSVAILLAFLAIAWAWQESSSQQGSAAWTIVLPPFLVVAGILGLLTAVIARRLTRERHHGRLEVTWRKPAASPPAG